MKAVPLFADLHMRHQVSSIREFVEYKKDNFLMMKESDHSTHAHIRIFHEITPF
jgi:hypothetical protein